MGNGMCSRKQKRILQSLLLLTVVFGFIYGAMLYYEVQSQLRKAEAVALKYQQHQESLSAQLQGKSGFCPLKEDSKKFTPISPRTPMKSSLSVLPGHSSIFVPYLVNHPKLYSEFATVV